MTFERDTDAEIFQTIWPTGYIETFEGYVNIGCSKYGLDDIANILGSFYDRKHTCLEIGSGGGLWTTNYLIPSFKHTICIDVAPKRFEGECVYIQLENKDFFCTGVQDDSIDFVFSYGVFPHFSSEAQATYLKSMYKKMKSGAQALILFANFKRHPDHKNSTEEQLLPYKNSNISPEGAPWFYMDLDLTKEIVKDAGFTDFQDLLPDFRDTLAYFRKN